MMNQEEKQKKTKKKKEEQYPIEDKKLPKIDEPTIEETRRILALYEEQVKQNAENDLIETNDEQSDTLVDDLNLDEVDFKFYLLLSYEDRIKLLKKLDENQKDLTDYLDLGFDAWLSRNYDRYKYGKKEKELYEAYVNLKSIPKFNNQEIIDLIVKRQSLASRFISSFKNDIYYDDKKPIKTKRFVDYPILRYHKEIVSYSYLEEIKATDYVDYAKKIFVNSKEEALSLVRDAKETISSYSEEYYKDYAYVNRSIDVRGGKKFSNACKKTSICALVFFAITQLMYMIPITRDFFKDNMLFGFVNNFAGITTLSILIPFVTFGMLFLLYKRLYILEGYKDAVIVSLGNTKYLERLENDLMEDDFGDDNKIEKLILKSKKRKVRVDVEFIKHIKNDFNKNCVKFREKKLPNEKVVIWLERGLMCLHIMMLSTILSLIFSQTISYIFEDAHNIGFLWPFLISLGLSVAFTSLTLLFKKKNVPTWLYILTLIFSCIITIVIVGIAF